MNALLFHHVSVLLPLMKTLLATIPRYVQWTFGGPFFYQLGYSTESFTLCVFVCQFNGVWLMAILCLFTQAVPGNMSKKIVM